MPLETVNVFDKKGNEEFKPTAEELRVITEKMKDPEFRTLMQEYMDSLSDPETRREEEEYLKQMEREAREGGDYSFDFIFPRGAFVAQLLQTNGYKKGIKVFINVCHSEKVDEFKEETTGDRYGSHWHVPVAVSQEREEDYENVKVVLYDAVFHPKTVNLANTSDKFMCFLIEIAVEHINSGYKKEFGFEFRRLSSSIVSIGTPQNQTVRREKGKSAFPFSTEPVSKAPVRGGFSGASSSSNSVKATAPLTQTQPTKAPTKAPATKAPAAPPAPPSAPVEPQRAPEKLPKFTVLHKGEIDMIDAWQWKIVEKRVGIPKELIVKIEFTGVSSASWLDIDVAEDCINIAKGEQHPYYGSLKLPFVVDSTPLSAKFEKVKQILTLTLKVVPPTRPVDGITADDMLQEEKSKMREAAAAEKRDLSEAEAVAKSEVVAQCEAPTPGVRECADKLPSPQQAADMHAESPIPTAAPQSEPKDEKVDVVRAEPEVSPKKIAHVDPLAELNAPAETVKPVESSHLPVDRASQLMAKMQEARLEREAAEAAERAAEGAVPKPAPLPAEDSIEVIDLRKKQDEWMAGVKKQQEAQEAQRLAEEEEQAREAQEALRKQQKEAKKKMDAEREEARLEAELQKKMEELPLKSRYIFDIE